MLGERCKEWRVAHGFTQLEVARVGGFSPTLVSLFERGQRKGEQVLKTYVEMGFPCEVSDILTYLWGESHE